MWRQEEEDSNKSGSIDDKRVWGVGGLTDGENGRDEEETKAGEGGRVGVKDAWCVCSPALHQA